MTTTLPALIGADDPMLRLAVAATLPRPLAGRVRPTPHVPHESSTLGLSHLQFEAMLTAGRDSDNPNDLALVAMLGLLGLLVFEATGSDMQALGESSRPPRSHCARQGRQGCVGPTSSSGGPRVDRAVADRTSGPSLLNRNDRRMDRHAATR